LRAGFHQLHGELGLLFGDRGGSATAGGGGGHRGGAHAELLFDGLDQVIEFHDGHAVQRRQKGVFIECHYLFPELSWSERG
jgi:hypothetical protein